MSLLDVWLWFLVLGTAAVFFGGVWVLSRLARRHAEDDPRAGSKVAVAIVASLLLGGGSLWVLYGFEQDGIEGMHATMVSGFASSLNSTIGEADYLDAGKTIDKKLSPQGGSIPTIILPKLQATNATLAAYFAAHPEQNETSRDLPAGVRENMTTRADTLNALSVARKEAQDALVKQRSLTPNHKLWLMVKPLLDAGNDEGAEELVHKAISPQTVTEILPLNAQTAANNEAPCERDTKTGLCNQPLVAKGLEHTYYDSHALRNVPFSEGGPAAFEHQREFRHQMHEQMLFLMYTSVTASLMAPFAFAGGSILNRAYVPSDTVGYKPYPAKAMGWFLLVMGVFGPLFYVLLDKVPPLDIFSPFAILFAAWMLRDMHKRSVQGQIAL